MMIYVVVSASILTLTWSLLYSRWLDLSSSSLELASTTISSPFLVSIEENKSMSLMKMKMGMRRSLCYITWGGRARMTESRPNPNCHVIVANQTAVFLSFKFFIAAFNAWMCKVQLISILFSLFQIFLQVFNFDFWTYLKCMNLHFICK